MRISLMQRNKPLLVRVLIVILALLVLVMCPLNVFGQAHAIAIIDDLAVAGVVVVIAALLVAGGFISGNQDNLISTAKQIYDDFVVGSNMLFDELCQLVRNIEALQARSKQAVIHVSQRLWDALFGSFSVPASPVDITNLRRVTLDTMDSVIAEINAANPTVIYSNVFLDTAYPGFYYYKPSFRLSGNPRNDVFLYRYSGYPFDSAHFCGEAGYAWSSSSQSPFTLMAVKYADKRFRLYFVQDGSPCWHEFFDIDVTQHPFDIAFDASVSQTVVCPPADALVKVPSMPKQGVDGKVSIPPIPLNPNDLRTKDLPDVVLPGAGVKDLPYDAVIDASSGVVVDNATDIPTTPPDGLPTVGDISLPELIVSKFPFCIPFDLYNMLSLFACDPIEPVFHIPFKIGKLVNEEIVLDFKKFSGLIEILRWGEQILFIGGLAYVTRNYIKW